MKRIIEEMRSTCEAEGQVDTDMTRWADELESLLKTHVLVPREPTKEMLDALCSIVKSYTVRFPNLRPTSAYRKMIKAAEEE